MVDRATSMSAVGPTWRRSMKAGLLVSGRWGLSSPVPGPASNSFTDSADRARWKKFPRFSSRLGIGTGAQPGRPGASVRRAALVLVAELCHELGQERLELLHLRRAQKLGPLLLELGHFFRGGPVIGPAHLGAADDGCPGVAWIGDPLDIAGGLQLIDQIAHRLLGHCRLSSQLGDAVAVGTQEFHDSRVRVGDLVEATLVKSRVDAGVEIEAGNRQKGANHEVTAFGSHIPG